MQGIKHVRVHNKRVHYDLDFRRNITIINGNSATGKTTLINLIQDALDDKGVYLECKVPCKVLRNTDWELILLNTENSIIFMDEDFKYVFTNKFASIVKNSSNYYVIINRDEIPALPYSITEIYDINTSGKYHNLIPSYAGIETAASPDVLVTEDKNSGYEFFKYQLR